MPFEWHSYPSPDAAAEASAAHIVRQIEEALGERGYATLALSGGTTPKPMFADLAASRLPWDRIHVFWVDERAVPPTDPESNYKLAAETLLIRAQVPQRNIHRMRGELMPEAAARSYAREIREFFGLDSGEMPEFDVVHRGMGPDAHTASLFPGQPLIEDRQGLAAAIYVEKVAMWRITLLPGPLLAARSVVVLAAGADKAEMVRAVFREPYDPLRYPSQLGMREGRGAVWFMDQAAAALIEEDAWGAG
jgi:6-phosphogluconolactonase